MNVARTTEELLSLGLPKWPQCRITGTKLPIEQALEIIRRTDKFFNAPMFANDRKALREIQYTLDIPVAPRPEDFDSTEEFDTHWCQYWEDIRTWQDKWGYIFLQYLDNNWILSDMAQGAQGWCNPDGTIDYHYNIGKWPESTEVFEELKTIATSFPFVELEVTLMNKEYGEEDSEPIISFLVRNGNVEVVDPVERNLHEEFGREIKDDSEDFVTKVIQRIIKGGGSDTGISMFTIRSWRKYLL